MPSTDQSIVVNAPIDTVWGKFNDFHDLSWAADVISELEKIGNRNGDETGAIRILNGVFHETLVEMNPDTYLVRYSIDDGPSPVSKDEVHNYLGVIQLSPAPDQGGTLVRWTSSWQSSSQDAVAFCHGIYVALLNELAATFE